MEDVKNEIDKMIKGQQAGRVIINLE